MKFLYSLFLLVLCFSFVSGLSNVTLNTTTFTISGINSQLSIGDIHASDLELSIEQDDDDFDFIKVNPGITFEIDPGFWQLANDEESDYDPNSNYEGLIGSFALAFSNERLSCSNVVKNDSYVCGNSHCVSNADGSVDCDFPAVDNKEQGIFLDSDCLNVNILDGQRKTLVTCVYPKVNSDETDDANLIYNNSSNTTSSVYIVPSLYDEEYRNFLKNEDYNFIKLSETGTLNACPDVNFLDTAGNAEKTKDCFYKIIDYYETNIDLKLNSVIINSPNTIVSNGLVPAYLGTGFLLGYPFNDFNYYVLLTSPIRSDLDSGISISDVNEIYYLSEKILLDLMKVKINHVDVVGTAKAEQLFITHFDDLNISPNDNSDNLLKVLLYSDYKGITNETPIIKTNPNTENIQLLTLHNGKNCNNEDNLCDVPKFDYLNLENTYMDSLAITQNADLLLFNNRKTKLSSDDDNKMLIKQYFDSYNLLLEDYLTNTIVLGSDSSTDSVILNGALTSTGLILTNNIDFNLDNSVYSTSIFSVANSVNNPPALVSFGNASTKTNNGSVNIKNLWCNKYTTYVNFWNKTKLPMNYPMLYHVFGTSNKPYFNIENVKECKTLSFDYLMSGAGTGIGDSITLPGYYGFGASMFSEEVKENISAFFEAINSNIDSTFSESDVNIIAEDLLLNIYPIANNTADNIITISDSSIGMYLSKLKGNKNNICVYVNNSEYFAGYNVFYNFDNAIQLNDSINSEILNNMFATGKLGITSNSDVTAFGNIFKSVTEYYEVDEDSVLQVGGLLNKDENTSIGFVNNPYCQSTNTNLDCSYNFGSRCDYEFQMNFNNPNQRYPNILLFRMPIYYPRTKEFLIINSCCIGGNYYMDEEDRIVDRDKDNVAENVDNLAIALDEDRLNVSGLTDFAPLTFNLSCTITEDPNKKSIYLDISGKENYNSIDDSAQFKLDIVNNSQEDVEITDIKFKMKNVRSNETVYDYESLNLSYPLTIDAGTRLSDNYTDEIMITNALKDYNVLLPTNYVIIGTFSNEPVSDTITVKNSAEFSFYIDTIKSVKSPDMSILTTMLLLIVIIGIFVIRRKY